MSQKEKDKILEYQLDENQLKNVWGGKDIPEIGNDCSQQNNADINNCTNDHYRRQYDCAATVEAGSWCMKNDACISLAIEYDNCHCAYVGEKCSISNN